MSTILFAAMGGAIIMYGFYLRAQAKPVYQQHQDHIDTCNRAGLPTPKMDDHKSYYEAHLSSQKFNANAAITLGTMIILAMLN